MQENKPEKRANNSKATQAFIDEYNKKSNKRFAVFIGIILVLGIGLIFYLKVGSPSMPTSSSSNVSKPDFESDLEERCKDWIYNRNRAYKLGREGDQNGAEQARRAMNQFDNDLKKRFSESQISAEIARLEASGYKAGF